MLTFAALIPVLSWLCLNAAAGLLLTMPLKYRWYFLPAILIPAAVSFRTVRYLSFSPGLSELWGIITMIGFMHFSSLLYIKKWTLCTTQDNESVSKATGSWLNGTTWAQMYKAALNPRFIRIPYKSIIVSEQQFPVKSTAIHMKFSLKRALWLLLQIAVYLSFNRLTITRLTRNISIVDFIPDKTIFPPHLLQWNFGVLRNPVLVRGTLIRIWFTVNSIWTPILLLDSIHTALAILFIYVIRTDIPDDWPDLFGSPLEAFSLGRFWSRFWHRLHLSGYSDYANLLISMLPGCFRRNAVVKKVLMTFLLFLISGLIHQFISWRLGTGCADYADIQFFCMNGAAVILESALLQLRSLFPGPRDSGLHKTSSSHGSMITRPASVRLLGYVWVMTFFVWTVPRLYYPRVHCVINQQLRARSASA